MIQPENASVKLERIGGFDAAGEVFIGSNKILRGIYPGGGELYRRVLRTYEEHDLFRLGIVPTRESDDEFQPDLDFELLLEHERIPFVSYPHEWPAPMLQAAAVFHIDLYLELMAYNLTIKDWHPYNILFKGVEPIFIDFTSIIPVENLQQEEYLTPPFVPLPFRRLWDTTSAYLYEMHRRMFVPYFLLPLYIMSRGRHRTARTRMLGTTLNASDSVIRKDEVFSGASLGRLGYDFWEWRKRLTLIERDRSKPRFWRTVREEVSRLKVAVTQSDYSGYYESKNEDASFEPSPDWTDKQRVVYEALRRFKPDTVLDVAGNTGWFAMLAARQGCRVVSFDVDEACVDRLYERALNEKLPILPLAMDLTNPTPDIFPKKYENEAGQNQIRGDFPLLLAAEKRLKCDLVLALAIAHHLALGYGQDFSQILGLLSAFSGKYLVLEFVPKEDELVAVEPEFFPALNANPGGFDWYTLENLRSELDRRYTDVEVRESFPQSRKILICSK